MNRLEQIEKLREKADVTYEEARQALENADGDLLDAVIALEKQGKVAAPEGKGHFRSTPGPETEPDGGQEDIYRVNKSSVGDAIEKVGKFCVAVIDKGNNSFLQIFKDDDCKFKIPLTVLALLLVFLTPVTLALLGIGLIVGYRYKLEGLRLEDEF